MMYKTLTWLLGIGFIIYGLMRIAGGYMVITALNADMQHEGQDIAVDKVINGLAELENSALISLSEISYMTYTVVMGVILVIGTLAVLFKKKWGAGMMWGYFILWALLFANYQVINIKLLHLAVSFLLFLSFIWISRKSASTEA